MKIKQKLRRAFLSRKRGYTLVEVIVASALLAVLMIGMAMFIGPVMSNVSSNEKSARASNVAESVQYYLSRNLRNAAFVAIFTEAKDDHFIASEINDSNKPQYAILSAAKDTSMASYVAAQLSSVDNKELYELKCMSIRKMTDTKSGETKYFLYDEEYDRSAAKLTGNRTPVFEDCFYEGLFMGCTLSQVQSDVASPTSGDSSDPSSGSSTVTKDRSALEIRINLYDDKSMDISNLIFSGRGYTELINIKNAKDNEKLGLPYKILKGPSPDNDFPISMSKFYSEGDRGENTYIFYVVRKVI